MFKCLSDLIFINWCLNVYQIWLELIWCLNVYQIWLELINVVVYYLLIFDVYWCNYLTIFLWWLNYKYLIPLNRLKLIIYPLMSYFLRRT